MTRLPIVALVLLACASCRFHVGDFAVFGDFRAEDIDIPDDVESIPIVEGVDMMNVVIFVPINDPPTVENALKNALESTDGDVLIDVTVEKEWFWIPFIYGWNGYRIRGRPVAVPAAPPRARSGQ